MWRSSTLSRVRWQEEYSEPYVEQVHSRGKFTDAPETYEVPEQHAYEYEKKHKGIGGVFWD